MASNNRMAAILLILAATATFRGSYENSMRASGQKVPALFVFGDSLADAGNNNRFPTLAKANHPPYGRDFPGGVPTGRFINGFNAIDYLAFLLDLPLVPIFEDISTRHVDILKGVNFASAASGIQPYTGLNFGKITSLDSQIQQFVVVKHQIESSIGVEDAQKIFTNAVFYIVTGSNDWLNTYFFPASPLPHIYTPSQYRDLLINRLLSQMEDKMLLQELIHQWRSKRAVLEDVHHHYAHLQAQGMEHVYEQGSPLQVDEWLHEILEDLASYGTTRTRTTWLLARVQAQLDKCFAD